MFKFLVFTLLELINFVTVSDINNKPNKYGKGCVGYEYQIAETEISNTLYCLFLNSVVKNDDSLNLYTPLMSQYFWGGINKIENEDGIKFEVKEGFENYPVCGVTWKNAIRFVNWLNYNYEYLFSDTQIERLISETSGDSKHGAYDTSNLDSVENIKRNSGAIFYLPNIDEWTKSCFYDGHSYNEYVSDSINCYNKNGWRYDFPHLAALVKGPISHYGTINQVGNLAEWVENDAGYGNGWKLFLGGSLIRPLYSSKMNYYEADAIDKSIASVGFRVVKIENNVNKAILEPPHKEKTISNIRKKYELEDLNGGKYVLVGDPRNEGDILNSYKGRVAYTFEISKYELTNAEYARFLSSCCRFSDPFDLYNQNMSTGVIGGIIKDSLKTGGYVYYAKNGWEKKPVTYISYYNL